MRILLSGIAGFIGNNFANMYANEHELTGLDCLTYASNLLNLKPVRDKINFHNVDISRKEWRWMDRAKSLYEYVADQDIIVNMAAESSVNVSIKDPEIFIKSNVIGTFNLLECARKYDLPFVQISTDEVYGDTNGKPPSAETDALFPSSPYSASKASADMLVMAYARTYGLKCRVTRTCNNYGRFQHEEKLIPQFINSALDNLSLNVFGSGTASREWIAVNDNCRGIMTVIEKGECLDGKTLGKGIYNIGSGEYLDVNNVAKEILASIPSKSEIKHVGERPGEDMRYALDSSKLRALGWEPKVKFEDGLRQTIDWYMEMIE